CLTMTEVKERLKAGQAALATALDVGLSGPGRLHDLCIALGCGSPGEIKSGGAGVALVAGIAESPFGPCLIAESPRGICHLSLFEPGDEEGEWSKLSSEWPNATIERSDRTARILAAQIFAADAGAKSRVLKAYVRGTA